MRTESVRSMKGLLISFVQRGNRYMHTLLLRNRVLVEQQRKVIQYTLGVLAGKYFYAGT